MGKNVFAFPTYRVFFSVSDGIKKLIYVKNGVSRLSRFTDDILLNGVAWDQRLRNYTVGKFSVNGQF